MRLLWFAILLSITACSAPEDKVDAVGSTLPMSTEEAAAVVEEQAPPVSGKVAPADPARPSSDSVRLSDLIGAFGVDDLAKTPIAPCDHLTPSGKWPEEIRRRGKPRFVYVPGRQKGLELKGDPLFIREIRDGEYLLGALLEEHTPYLTLTVINDSLRVLYEDWPMSCFEEGDQETTEFRFTSDTSYAQSDLGNLLTPFSGGRLFSYVTNLTSIGRNGSIPVEEIAREYQVYILDTFQIDPQHSHGQTESTNIGQRRIPSIENFIPINTIGIVELARATTNSYRLRLRFPGVKNTTIDSLLSFHYQNDHSGAAYTKDVTITTTPLSVTFFDALGQTIIIDTLTRLNLRFQCENDGPLIVDPIYELEIPKTAYPGRPSSLLEGYGKNIVGAAIANYQPDELTSAADIDYIPGKLVFKLQPPGFPKPLLSITQEDEHQEEYGGDVCWYYRALNSSKLIEINCCGP